MKLTKYEHACFTVEKDDKSIVVDPGNITDDFVTPQNAVAVVITHEHPDHFDESKLQKIVNDNPGLVIIGHQNVVEKVKMTTTKSISAGESIDIGPFNLKFFGGKHAVIHSSVPIIDNLGVMINDTVYYPGDSYAEPGVPVKVLAVPTSGPWLKIGDVADFVLSVNPELAFSTHDAHSSEKNKELIDRLLPNLIDSSDTSYMRLTKPLEIDG